MYVYILQWRSSACWWLGTLQFSSLLSEEMRRKTMDIQSKNVLYIRGCSLDRNQNNSLSQRCKIIPRVGYLEQAIDLNLLENT
jgi:hypothetical protein